MREAAWLASITTLGLGAGGLLCGVLADRFGRRSVIRWTLLVVIVGSLGAACAPSLLQLLIWRLVTSLGLGGETVLAYAMLGEFLPPALRGRWLARLGFLSNAGMPLALLLGYFVLPLPQGWRWMFAIPGVAAIPILYARRHLIESPRWLATQNRVAEAAAVLARIEQSIPQALPLPTFPAPTDAQRADASARPIWTLLGAEYRARLLVGASICIATMSAIFGFVTWLPTFFVTEGRNLASSSLFAAIISVGCPMGVLLGMLITDRAERKWSIVVCSVIVTLTGAWYANAHSVASILVFGFLVVAAVYAAGTVGMTGYIPELFPTAVRMRGVGLSYTAGRSVAVMMPFAVVPVFSVWGQAGVVAMVGAIVLVQALLVAMLGPLTLGRSLEKI